jgi:hypothetical protein
MITGALSPVSNREDFELQVELYDEEADEPVTLDGVAEVVIEVAPRDRSSRSVLSARMSAGQITSPELGVIECVFAAAQMQALCAGTYDVGGTLTKDGITVQFIIGTLPVLDGVVSR